MVLVWLHDAVYVVWKGTTKISAFSSFNSQGFVCFRVCFSSLVPCSEMKINPLSPILSSCCFAVVGVCIVLVNTFLGQEGYHKISWSSWVKNSGVTLPADFCLMLCLAKHWLVLTACRSSLFLTRCCCSLCWEKLLLLSPCESSQSSLRPLPWSAVDDTDQLYPQPVGMRLSMCCQTSTVAVHCSD